MLYTHMYAKEPWRLLFNELQDRVGFHAEFSLMYVSMITGTVVGNGGGMRNSGAIYNRLMITVRISEWND